MPEKTQTITVAGYDAERLQAIAYGALQQLNWTTKYAGHKILVGYTPKSMSRYANEITITTENNQITVTSKMIHGEAFDMMGRTKKDIANFLAAFETAKAKATDLNINEWNEKISALKEDTVKVAEQEVKQAGEVDKVMNLSTGNKFVTYGIIGINILVFVIMVVNNVDIMSPTGVDIINWGGNFSTLTLSGDWWRLISCVFVHIGIIHIAFNMYALYMVGIYLEPMLGKTKYITAYLCTGVFASLASLWWHKDPVASAGASGAIFGMYGVFLALLSTSLIPKHVRNSLLQSIGVFVVYNLIYGMKSGVDNSAHVGGLVSGLLIGYIYYPGLRAGKKSMAMAGLIVILTVAAAMFYLQNNKVSDEERRKVKDEMGEYQFKDADKYNEQLNKFAEAEEKAIAPLQNASTDASELADKLQNISLPEWEKAEEAVKKMKTYKVSANALRKAELLEKYIGLRKEDINLRVKRANENDNSESKELEEINTQILSIINELKNLQ